MDLLSELTCLNYAWNKHDSGRQNTFSSSNMRKMMNMGNSSMLAINVKRQTEDLSYHLAIATPTFWTLQDCIPRAQTFYFVP